MGYGRSAKNSIIGSSKLVISVRNIGFYFLIFFQALDNFSFGHFINEIFPPRCRQLIRCCNCEACLLEIGCLEGWLHLLQASAMEFARFPGNEGVWCILHLNLVISKERIPPLVGAWKQPAGIPRNGPLMGLLVGVDRSNCS